MKTHFAGVLAAVLGLATVSVAQAGDRVPVANGSLSINAPVPDVAGTFRELDRDGRGSLSMGEFWRVDRLLRPLQVGSNGLPQTASVTNIGAFWSDTDLTALFLTLDSNRDGVLSLSEFAAVNRIAPTFVQASY